MKKNLGNDLFGNDRKAALATASLLRASELARRLVRSIDGAQKAASRSDWALALEQLTTAENALGPVTLAAQEWEAIRTGWIDASERQFLELEADLLRGCERFGWSVDGHWPDLYVERAICVSLDAKKRVANISGRTLPNTDAVAILSALKPVVRELIPKKFSGTEFMQSFCEAYDEVRGASSQVAILHVYRSFVMRMQKSRFWRDARRDGFLGLSLDQFRARLTRALEMGNISSRDGRTLRFYPPIDIADAIFVYQPAERRFGHVGRIEFVAT